MASRKREIYIYICVFVSPRRLQSRRHVATHHTPSATCRAEAAPCAAAEQRLPQRGGAGLPRLRVAHRGGARRRPGEAPRQHRSTSRHRLLRGEKTAPFWMFEFKCGNDLPRPARDNAKKTCAANKRQRFVSFRAPRGLRRSRRSVVRRASYRFRFRDRCVICTPPLAAR
jgi:hypothetical protein